MNTTSKNYEPGWSDLILCLHRVSHANCDFINGRNFKINFNMLVLVMASYIDFIIMIFFLFRVESRERSANIKCIEFSSCSQR